MGTMQCCRTLHFSSLSHFFAIYSVVKHQLFLVRMSCLMAGYFGSKRSMLWAQGDCATPSMSGLQWTAIPGVSSICCQNLHLDVSDCTTNQVPGTCSLFLLYIYHSAYIASCWIMTILELGSLSHPIFSKAFSNFLWPLLECVTGSTATVGIPQISQ